GLEVGAVAVLHDPRVGVGEVGLRLGLRAGGLGGLVPGLGDGLFVAAAGAFLTAALFIFGVAAFLLSGLGLDLGAGGLQLGQALLAAVQLGGQIGLLAIGAEPLVLGGIGGLRISQQGGRLRLQFSDLGLDAFLLLDQAPVAHRLVLGGACFQLRAIQSDAAHRDHAQLLREMQGLQEQVGERIEVAAAEAGDRAEVGGLAGGQE